MSRIVFRTMALILILNLVLIVLMQLAGTFRDASTILVTYDNDEDRMKLIISDTGAIFRQQQSEFPRLSPDACSYVNFRVNTEQNQAEIEFFDILGNPLSQHIIPQYVTTWRTFWSDDGEYIALLNVDLSSGAVMLSVIHTETGQAWQIIDKAILLDSVVSWSPHNQYIAFTGYSETIDASDVIFDFQNNQNPDAILEQKIFIYDFRNDALIEIAGEALDTARYMMWSNDERYLLLLLGNSPETLAIIDIENEILRPIEGLQSIRQAATWSPDNQLLVAGQTHSVAQEQEMLYRVNAETGTYQAIREVPFGLQFGEWTSDGKKLLYFEIQERAIHILNMSDYSEWHIPSKAGELMGHWTNDNRIFSTRMSGGYLWFVQADTGQTFATEQQIKELYGWLNNEEFIYTTRDRETHLARFQNGHFEILARYPIRQIQGICVMNRQ